MSGRAGVMHHTKLYILKCQNDDGGGGGGGSSSSNEKCNRKEINSLAITKRRHDICMYSFGYAVAVV